MRSMGILRDSYFNMSSNIHICKLPDCDFEFPVAGKVRHHVHIAETRFQFFTVVYADCRNAILISRGGEGYAKHLYFLPEA